MLIPTAVLALSLQIAAPSRVATVEVKGEPIRLAWSADGSQLAIQTGERDKAGMLNNNPRFYVLSAADGKISPAQAWPEWADQYWTWKSNNYTPWASTTTASGFKRATSASRLWMSSRPPRSYGGSRNTTSQRSSEPPRKLCTG